MSRVAFLADIHVGNHGRYGGEVKAGLNHRCRTVLDVLARACARAHEVGCSEMVILGDLFDSSKPTPQMVRAVRDVLVRERFDCVSILRGNHDTVSEDAGDHALGPLDYDGISIIEKPILSYWRGPSKGIFWFVPYAPGNPREWLRQILEEFQDNEGARVNDHRILCLHMGIVDEKTPHFLAGAGGAIEAVLLKELMEEFKINAVVAGDWHERRVLGRIMQVGSLAPTGWNNPGLQGYGTLAWYDAAKGKLGYEELPGPRFVTAAPGELIGLFAQGATKTAHPLYVKVNCASGEVDEVQAFIQQLQLRSDRVGFFEVCPDGAEAQAAARTAATVARSAETLEQALAGYVEEMVVGEGVDRAAVLSKSRRYLGV